MLTHVITLIDQTLSTVMHVLNNQDHPILDLDVQKL